MNSNSLKKKKDTKGVLLQATYNSTSLTAFCRCIFGCQSTGRNRHGTSGCSSSRGRSASPVNRTTFVGSQRRIQGCKRAVYIDRRLQYQRISRTNRANICRIISDGNFSVAASNLNTCHIFGSGTGTILLRIPGGGRNRQIIRRGNFIDHSLRTRGQRQTFRNTRTNRVILISGQRNGGQNTNNRHDDHQFDEGETFLHCFHDFLLERVVKWIFGIWGGY